MPVRANGQWEGLFQSGNRERRHGQVESLTNLLNSICTTARNPVFLSLSYMFFKMSHLTYTCQNTHDVFFYIMTNKNEVPAIIMHIYVQTFNLQTMVGSPWSRFHLIIF